MKKIVLFLFCALNVCVTNILAENVDVITAENVARLFMTESAKMRNVADVSLVYTLNDADGMPSVYVFNVNDSGFVLVSADDNVKPVLGYSTEGVFDATTAAESFMSVMRSYRDEIQYIRDNHVERSSDIEAEWDLVKSTGRIMKQRNNRSVTPLVEVTWNQNEYYNDQCPEDPEGPNGHVYAGCVATAMSQVMKYWNYPETGNGSHSYTPGGWGPYYPTEYANFGETDYHFEMMPNALDSTSTDEEIFYIAQLQHHCGVAVEMMYGPTASGAYSEDVPYALENYFNYSNAVQLKYRDFYDNNTWKNMLKDELDEGRPLYYSGSDDAGQGGHAFVCDGYDENDFFHFNWGWSGYFNELDLMNLYNRLNKTNEIDLGLKLSSILFELYGFVIINKLFINLGFNFINNDEVKKSYSLEGLELYYVKNEYKIVVTYENFIKHYIETNNSLATVFSTRNKPDYTIVFYKNDKFLTSLILEMKYRNINYLMVNDDISNIIDNYAMLVFKEDDKISRSAVDEVIIINPDKEERKISSGIAGKIMGFNVDKDLEDTKCFKYLKEKIKGLLK